MTALDYKQRAARARALLADEVLLETFAAVRQRQIDLFLAGAPADQIQRAQAVVAALQLILDELGSALAEELVQDHRKGSTA
jgi:CHASE3 domain sensor protein